MEQPVVRKPLAIALIQRSRSGSIFSAAMSSPPFTKHLAEALDEEFLLAIDFPRTERDIVGHGVSLHRVHKKSPAKFTSIRPVNHPRPGKQNLARQNF